MSSIYDSPNPCIYVACLASYNGGVLHGAWIDVTELSIKEEIADDIRAMLDASPTCGAEEWEIHDFMGWGSYEPGGSLQELCDVAEAIHLHGLQIFSAAYENFHDVSVTLQQLDDGSFVGRYGSLSEWAEETLESTGALAEIPENLRQYFDYDAWARDAELGGDVYALHSGGQVLVFENR